jgi:hypothetical protein
MSESLPRGFAAHVAAETTVMNGLASDAKLEAIEARSISPEMQQLNNIAQAEIWGTDGRIEGLRDPEAFKLDPKSTESLAPLKTPIKGIVNEIRENSDFGSPREREAQVKTYEKDVDDLVNGESHFELCQAKLIMDLRMEDKVSSAKMLLKYIAKGMSMTDAATKVTDIYADKDYKRQQVIKEEGIFTPAEYVAKLKNKSEGKKTDPANPADPAEDPTKAHEAPTLVKEPKDKSKSDTERFAYDQSAISWYREKRKPELKKLKLGQRVVARAAMLVDYAAGTNTWNPGLYEKYADRKGVNKTPPAPTGNKPPTPPAPAAPTGNRRPPAPSGGTGRPADPNAKPGHPKTPENPYQHMQEVQYRDGATSLLFKTPGDIMDLSHKTTFKYATRLADEYGINVALARTKDGKLYGIGRGVVINYAEKSVIAVPDELSNIELEQPWKLPDGTMTDPITEVEFPYKHTQPGQPGMPQIDRESPADNLKRDLEEASVSKKLGY